MSPALPSSDPSARSEVERASAAGDAEAPGRSPLRSRLAALGAELAAREAPHREGLARATREAERLRHRVADGLEAYHAAVAAGGAPELRVELGPVRPDEKHVRAVQFDLARGRHRALVTVKSRGEVTLVGPFRAGRTEGPCKSFPLGGAADSASPEGEGELAQALAAFLEAFLQEAATP